MQRGRPSAIQLERTTRFACHGNFSQPPVTKNAILNTYNDVFEELGHLGDSTFVTDEIVKPVQHTPRHVPVSL